MKMHAFIALELPDRIKKNLEKIQKDLMAAGVQARWVKPNLAHLTLAFLGSTTADKINTISFVIEEISGEIKPIKLKFSKLGCFPTPTKARVIFIDLQGELDKFDILATNIRKRLKKTCLPAGREKIWFDRKPPLPHVTIGRLKKRENLTETIKKIKIKGVEFVAKKICLNQSTLTPSGPVYKKLKCVFLE